LAVAGALVVAKVRLPGIITAHTYPVLPGPQGEWASRKFLGEQSCRQCHAERCASYEQTSHFNSMRMPDVDEPVGIFPATLKTFTPEVWFEAGRNGDNLVVTSIEAKAGSAERRRAEPVAMIMGSGKLSHSLFYRRGDALFQMPMFFFSPLGEWMLVPGFMDEIPFWERAIKPRCLDCHATYVEHIPHTRNSYRYDNAILEISCERCHGRGSEHVAYHQANPTAQKAVAIVNPQTLDRQRQLEICGQCHGESGKLVRAAFSYTPGEPLADYVHHEKTGGDDNFVRSANQSQRLEMSKCFQKSAEMTCTSCHNPHELEREDLPRFSQRCQQCHDASTHPGAAELQPRLTQNCIDCHMPKRDDEILPFKVATGERIKLIQMRDHAIAIYPDEAEKLRKKWAQPNASLAADNARPAIARERMVYAWHRKAKACLTANDRAGAIAALQESLQYDPRNLPSLLALTEAMLVQKNFEQAGKYARAALEADPKSIPSLMALAICSLNTGAYEEAIARYREVLAVAPDDRNARNDLAWLLATVEDPQIRDGAEAVRLAKSLVAEPEKATSSNWDTLAAAYAEANQFDRAIESAEKALTGAMAAQPADAANIERIRGRLEGYRRGQPHREPRTLPN
jgi:tetratricopeptide (TPR) repeat protein